MSPRKKSQFNEMDLPHEEDHPLDVLSRNRMSEELNDKVNAAVQVLTAALGEKISPWLTLEALLKESIQERGEILYNLGFEHGMVTGRSRKFVIKRPAFNLKEYRGFATEIRKHALLSELPRTLRAAALLETAWGLILDVK